jgi:phage terminase large subunit
VLCTREIQNSIKDSVHKLLKDQINEMGLNDYFIVTRDEIRSKIGSEFIFKGLRHNIQEIKSTEGIDICWVEEAQSVSKESWDLLIPTIRKEGSEIWVSFNPHFVEDETYQRFVVNPPPNAIVVKVNYYDNPFFPDVLREEMEYLKKIDYNYYKHIWEGECLVYDDKQVFKDKFEAGVLPVNDEIYQGLDFGFAVDPTALVRVYIVDEYLYISDEAYGVGVEIDEMPKFFEKYIPNYKDYLIRADSARPETISYLKRNFDLRIEGVEKWSGSVEDGIEFMKSFKKIIINPKCKHTLEEFRLYSYKTNSAGDILPQIEDKYNHSIDAIRYALTPLIKKRGTTKSFKVALI